MKVYFGAGIQGSPSKEARAERAALYRELISYVQELGHEVLFEHTATNSKEEVWKVLEKQFGPLPPPGPERGAFIRNRNIEAIEKMADAAIFEVSLPSLGVGIELAHAYLRQEMGLKQIPVLCLYQKDFWDHGLSIMVSGAATASNKVQVGEYSSKDDAFRLIREFFDEQRPRKTLIKGKLPELNRKKIETVLATFCEKRIPTRVKDQIRLTYDFRGNSATLVEERPAYDDPSHWTKHNVAQFRFNAKTLKWALFCRDRNSKWHEYQNLTPSHSIEDLIREVDRDPTGIFWG